jgi:hypothetical protein
MRSSSRIAFSLLTLGFVITAAHAAAFRVSEFHVSEPTIISAPNGERTVLVDINARGQVIGLYGPPVPPRIYTPLSPVPYRYGQSVEGSLGFIWSRAKGFEDIGELTPKAINNCGDIAGTLTAREPFHAFRRVRGQVQDLGTLDPSNPLAWSMGMGINDRGDVVGIASTGPSADNPDYPTTWTAFLWTESTGMVAITTLGVLDKALAINNRRQIAGSIAPDPMSSYGTATIWNRDFQRIASGNLVDSPPPMPSTRSAKQLATAPQGINWGHS